MIETAAFQRTPTFQAHYEPMASGGLVYSKRNHPVFSYEALDMYDDALRFASTDVEGGSSGSSLVDVGGEVIGVVGAKMGDPNQYQEAATVFIPLAPLWTKLRAVMGEQRVQAELVDGCVVSPETTALLELIRRLPV